MKEDFNTNQISILIKTAFEIKKLSLNPDPNFTRFLPFAAVRNMRSIVNSEIVVSGYQLFFKKFTEFLNTELLNKELLANLYEGEKNGALSTANEEVTFKLDGLEDKFQKKQEHAVYLKIVSLLTNVSFANSTVSQVLQISNALELFISKPGFFTEVDFSTKMDAIHYSLTHAEAFETAKMLVRLSDLHLLTANNLKKVSGYSQLNIPLFSSVLNKLSLTDGIPSLLTQEKFDVAINLKNLLTQENIEKIEKAAFAPEMLANLLFLLDKAGILTQDNFDQLIKLNKADFEKIVPVLATMHKTRILNQDNFLNFLNTFFDASIYDAKRDQVDAAPLEESNSSISLADRLCSTIISFLSRVEKFFQEFFDDILKYFNGKTEENEIDDNTNINQTVNTNNGVSCRTSLFGNSSCSNNINTNKVLETLNVVNVR